MHGSFDHQPRDSQSAYRNWNMKLIALPILGVVALIAFVISHPAASKWISDAAQAEFVGTDFVAGSSPADTAGPAGQPDPDREGLLSGRRSAPRSIENPAPACRYILNTATARIGEAVPPRHFIGRPMKVNWPWPSSASRLHRLSMWVMSRSRQAL